MRVAGRLLPHPRLSVALALVWILLNGFSAAAVAGGVLVGWLVPYLTTGFWPDRPHLRRPWRLFEYAAVVLWDICVANLQVAAIILTRRNADLRPAFVVVPLDITAPEAITILAGTITLTPGTVAADLADSGCALLVHCLDAPDPPGIVVHIKRRYEARLLEVFE